MKVEILVMFIRNLSITETEEDIVDAIKPALEYVPKEKILLTSECGFGHVPIDIVRNKMGFTGIIFSDDLSMKGSDYVGGIEAKVGKALESGCNMVLICNDRPAALEAINFLEKEKISQSQKVTSLKVSESISWADLENDSRRIDIIDKLNIIEKLKL